MGKRRENPFSNREGVLSYALQLQKQMPQDDAASQHAAIWRTGIATRRVATGRHTPNFPDNFAGTADQFLNRTKRERAAHCR